MNLYQKRFTCDIFRKSIAGSNSNLNTELAIVLTCVEITKSFLTVYRCKVTRDFMNVQVITSCVGLDL